MLGGGGGGDSEGTWALQHYSSYAIPTAAALVKGVQSSASTLHAPNSNKQHQADSLDWGMMPL